MLKVSYMRVRQCISYLMSNAIQGVGLVPRLNVVGVPSEARLLYVEDNNLSKEGPGDDRPVRRRRGLLDYFRPRPVYRPGSPSPWPGSTRFPSLTNRYNSQPSSYSGSRYFQSYISFHIVSLLDLASPLSLLAVENSHQKLRRPVFPSAL